MSNVERDRAWAIDMISGTRADFFRGAVLLSVVGELSIRVFRPDERALVAWVVPRDQYTSRLAAAGRPTW